MVAIIPGRRSLPFQPGTRYHAAVDMSGGSNDDAVLAIAHKDPDTERGVLDALISQTGRPPFDPMRAVDKFVDALREYRIGTVTGDSYAGETFKSAFTERGIIYVKADQSKSNFYSELEPLLNHGHVELLDIVELQEQLLTLIWRGQKIDHQTGDHDDYANSASIALVLAAGRRAAFAGIDWAAVTLRAAMPPGAAPPPPRPDPAAGSNPAPSGGMWSRAAADARSHYGVSRRQGFAGSVDLHSIALAARGGRR
jgi:hypothetical protein